MAEAKRTGQPTDGTAEHPGEDRDQGKPPPGSGLDRRIARNSATTRQSQDRPDGAVDPQQLDPKHR